MEWPAVRTLGALDHAVILVRDLETAERRMAALGFRPTPRGIHSPHMGTANATVVLPDRRTYFELLGVVAPTPANATQRARLARREGLYGLAFKTDDARATAAELAEAGLAQDGAVSFARAVELPQGIREARFTVARAREDATPGAWCFACQHHTPELVWREDHVEQPNGARAIVEIVGCASDPDALASAWRRLLGERVERTEGGIRARTGTATISFLTPEALRDRYGSALAGCEDGTPSLVLMALAVAERDRAAACLAQAGIAAQEGPEGALVVPAAAACGAAIEFRPTAHV